uniref:Uncharacterized protein n=1 Tax=Anguilla anguilla TaxID=7936 RepID=A0A0E9XLE4_ANGAN
MPSAPHNIYNILDQNRQMGHMVTVSYISRAM